MPKRFPQEAVLRDGRRVLIRPFGEQDTDALWAFFQTLPPNIRRFAWHNVEDRALIESWGRNVDYSAVLPLLAIDEKRVVADATLKRREGGPLRMVGRLSWLLDPEYRGQGLGTLLINNFISIGRSYGLRHLTCMLISDLEADAIRTLRGLGFDEIPIADYGSDPDGNPHDMVKLVLRL